MNIQQGDFVRIKYHIEFGGKIGHIHDIFKRNNITYYVIAIVNIKNEKQFITFLDLYSSQFTWLGKHTEEKFYRWHIKYLFFRNTIKSIRFDVYNDIPYPIIEYYEWVEEEYEKYHFNLRYLETIKEIIKDVANPNIATLYIRMCIEIGKLIELKNKIKNNEKFTLTDHQTLYEYTEMNYTEFTNKLIELRI